MVDDTKSPPPEVAAWPASSSYWTERGIAPDVLVGCAIVDGTCRGCDEAFTPGDLVVWADAVVTHARCRGVASTRADVERLRRGLAELDDDGEERRARLAS